MNFSKYIITSITTLCGERLFAQVTTAPQVDNLPNIMTIVLVGVVGIVIIAALWALVKTNDILYKNILRQQSIAQGIALPEPEPIVLEVESTASWWSWIGKSDRPIEREHEILLAHNFDGIRELDNSLPPWWINMFYATIVWSLGYMIYYHWGGNGSSSTEEYKQEVATAKKEIALALSGKAESIDESSVVALTDKSALSDGQMIFKASCISCHGQLGEGGVGPNFTDEHWIHGGGIKNVFKTVKYGVPEKGMIAWAATLRPSDMQKVGSYILTLKGTNPLNQKAPQGVVWVEESTTMGAADSTGVRK